MGAILKLILWTDQGKSGSVLLNNLSISGYPLTGDMRNFSSAYVLVVQCLFLLP